MCILPLYIRNYATPSPLASSETTGSNVDSSNIILPGLSTETSFLSFVTTTVTVPVDRASSSSVGSAYRWVLQPM